MNILFAGTPEFAVIPLEALAKEHSIKAVFTQPDRRAGRGKKVTPPPVKQAAEKIGCPVFQPSSLRDQTELIRSFNVDIIIVVAYGMLLPQEILDIPALGCINIHASLLPRWRGAAPIQRAIEAGDNETGVSIMRMELGLDTGPVYQMLKTAIEPHDTSATLHDKLALLGAQGITETLNKLETNPEFEPLEQDHSSSSYAKKISKDEAIIDWSYSAQTIHQMIRAFIPWPVCQTYHNGTRIRIWQTSISHSSSTFAPGTIIDSTDLGFEIACGDGVLQLEILQRDGSKPLSAQAFGNGYTLATGDVLGQPSN